jgi:hypothetical protein
VCAALGRACVCASTSTLFTGQLCALGASAIGQGDAADARYILTDYRQHVSRVAVQREAMLGPLAMLRVFAVPQRRVAARLASVVGYAGPDENALLSRSKNLRCKLQIGSAKHDHYRDSRLGLPRGNF